MRRKRLLFLFLMIMVSLAGCQSRGGEPEGASAAENSVSALQEQSLEQEIAIDSSREQSTASQSASEPAINQMLELTVQKIAPTQESALEEVTFHLNLPGNMNVEYDNKTPSVYHGDMQYLRTASMSSGVTEEMILSRQDGETITARKLDINAYNTILVTEPVEEPAKGYEYTYYILFDDDTVLPLTFFSSTGSDTDEEEFNRVVSSFELA